MLMPSGLKLNALEKRSSDFCSAWLGELQALHDRLERQLKQRDAFFATNEAFHFKLLEIAGNRWRQQIVADLRVRNRCSADETVVEKNDVVNCAALKGCANGH